MRFVSLMESNRPIHSSVKPANIQIYSNSVQIVERKEEIAPQEGPEAVETEILEEDKKIAAIREEVEAVTEAKIAVTTAAAEEADPEIDLELAVQQKIRKTS